MNTIKAYIYKNDKQKASEYLNTFSDLIRTFLSMSNKSLVSLGEELKMLEQYIKMEAMMLNDDFRFRKNIDETIDLQQTKIPSLIVQPFVENAFKHGLHSKTGKKELTLFICKTDENQITLNITDNGIGRQKAKKIKEAEQFSHQSFATTAVEKRIELLNRNEQRVGVVINDLFDEHNEPNGTSVIVTINVYE
jgi:LytS/YehU family sensor histidine kinase